MKKRSRDLSPPDITPLIDVVFLLLIFFMVSTVFKKEEVTLLLNLPKMENGKSQESPKKKITIELSSSEIAFNGKKLEFTDLDKSLKTYTDKTIPVEVRIDKEVKYERVVKVLDGLKKYQLTNLSLINDK